MKSPVPPPADTRSAQALGSLPGPTENREANGSLYPEIKHREIARRVANIQLGDHLCLFYERDPAEQLSITLPFIRQGLSHNERVIYIADEAAVDTLSGHLAQTGIDVEKEARAGRLKLWTRGEWRQASPANSGGKSLQVRRYVEEALSAGFRSVRFLVEMSWTLGSEITLAQLEHWEATLNAVFVPGFPARIICQYHRGRLSPEVLLAAIHTHPCAIAHDHVCSNLYYQAPLLLENLSDGTSTVNAPAPRLPVASRVDWMLSQLARASAAEEQRAELTLRQATLEEAEKTKEKFAEVFESITEGFLSLDEDCRITHVNRVGALSLGRPVEELTGANLLQEIPGIHGTKIERECQRAMERRTTAEFEEFYAPLARWFAVKAHPTPSGLAVFFRDITEARRAAESLRSTQAELEIQVRDLRRLHEISLRLAQIQELPALLTELLDAALEVHGTSRGLLSLAPRETLGLQRVVSRGLADTFVAKLAELPLEKTATGACFLQERRIVVEDIEHDPLHREHVEVARLGGFRAIHCTPMITREGKLNGVISIYFEKIWSATEREMRLMDLYARLAADLIEGAQLRERMKSELDQRQRVEEALRISEERFRLAVRCDGITLYEQDQAMRYTWLFPQHAEHAGALGRTDAEILGDAQAETLTRCKSEVLRTGVSQRLQVVTKLPLGERAYDLFIQAKRDASGQIVGVAGAALDVTERVRALTANLQLAAVVETTDDAIMTKDLTGVITSWNKGAERIFGYTSEEMIGKPVTLLIPPERHHDEEQILNRIRSGQRIEHFETVRRRKDGSQLEISLTVSPLVDVTGKIVGASKIGRDVTARKRLEQQHQALYELVARVNRAEALPEVFDAALEAICRCQAAQRASILLCDENHVMRFKAWRGLSDGYRKAVEGHSPWKHDDPAPQPVCIDDLETAELDPTLRTVVRNEGIRALAFIPLTYERKLLGKFMIYYDAAHRFSAAELRPVESIASQIAFAIARQKSGQAMEALVGERTQSLREAIAQMEEFSYSVSHDLRSPVRSMQGYASALMEDYGAQLDAQGREFLGRIIRSSTRMDRLIQDLLTYSRLSRREIELQPVSLDKLVQEVIQQYSELQPPQVEIIVHHPLLAVIGHEPSISQVLSNLLTNAVKFVAAGTKPRVEVSTEKQGDVVRLWIRDNGIGIKPEHHARLFGLFERIHPDTRYEGTGIGLAIVRKALERMGGAVGAESDGIHGSGFWVDLPEAK